MMAYIALVQTWREMAIVRAPLGESINSSQRRECAYVRTRGESLLLTLNYTRFTRAWWVVVVGLVALIFRG